MIRKSFHGLILTSILDFGKQPNLQQLRHWTRIKDAHYDNVVVCARELDHEIACTSFVQANVWQNRDLCAHMACEKAQVSSNFIPMCTTGKSVAFITR